MKLTAEQKLWLKYIGTFIGAGLIGAAWYVLPLLNDSTRPPIYWQPVLGAFIGAGLAAGVGTRLGRTGKTGVSSQVNVLEKRGVEPDQMRVIGPTTRVVGPDERVVGIEDRIVSPDLTSVISQVRALQRETGVKTGDMVVMPSSQSGVSVSMARFANPRIREVLDESETDSEETHLEREAERKANN